MNKDINKLKQVAITLLFLILIVVGIYFNSIEQNQTVNIKENNEISYEITNIPEYSGKAYVEINNNIPKFTDEDMNLDKDYYSSLKNKKVRTCYDKD